MATTIIIRCEVDGHTTATMIGNQFPPGWGPGTESYTYRCPEHQTTDTTFGNDLEGFTVHRDGKQVAGPFSSHNEAWAWILNHQGQSVDYAMRYGGYSIEQVVSEAQ